MKSESGYRFNISFRARSDAEKRAGDFLNSLGRRKSSVIVTAINEYIDKHCDVDQGQTQIQVNTFTLAQLEEKIRLVIEEKYATYQSMAPKTENVLSDTQAASQDIVDMLNDLELFSF